MCEQANTGARKGRFKVARTLKEIEEQWNAVIKKWETSDRVMAQKLQECKRDAVTTARLLQKESKYS